MNRSSNAPQIPQTLPVRSPIPGLIQEPWKAWALTALTAGIYGIVHHYRLNRELRDFGVEVDPVKSTLAFFPGAILLIPFLITLYRTGQRIGVAQETATLTPTALGWTSLLAGLVLFISIPYHQSELNKVWRVEAAQVR